MGAQVFQRAFIPGAPNTLGPPPTPETCEAQQQHQNTAVTAAGGAAPDADVSRKEASLEIPDN